MRKSFLFFLLLLGNIATSIAVSNNPPVINYTKADYRAYSKNWAISQDKNGLMYFGNDLGLLEFDGVRWRLYQIPGNKMAVRSVFADDSIWRIYVGSYEEFGFYERQTDGYLTYFSISSNIKNYHFHNEDIWKIMKLGNKIYFQSFRNIFVYDYNTGESEIIKPDISLMFFFDVNGEIIGQLVNKGLFKLVGNELVEIPGTGILKGSLVHTVLPMKNGNLLIGTATEGLFMMA